MIHLDSNATQGGNPFWPPLALPLETGGSGRSDPREVKKMMFLNDLNKVGQRILTLVTACGFVLAAGVADTISAEENVYRVALLVPGTADDASWSNAWADGAKRFSDNSKIEVVLVESLPGMADFEQQGAAFAGEGFDFVILADGRMVDTAKKLAERFPDTLFCQLPYTPGEDKHLLPNLCYADAEVHHANFFTGVLAALVSKSGHIASINGFEFPALTRQPETFVLGARCINADVQFSQDYIQSWTDTGLAKASAQSLHAAGADVVMVASDQAVLGAISAAKESDGNLWIIPSYYDSDFIAPDVVLTSAVHGMSDIAESWINMAASSNIGGDIIRFDSTTTMGIAAAPLYSDVDVLTADQRAQFDTLVAKVRSGEINIPDESNGVYTVGTVGSGQAIPLDAIGCSG